MSLIEKLMGMKLREEEEPTSKISIVGVGEVGSAIAYTILLKGLCSELALYDVNEEHLNGELLDLKQGLPFQTNMKLIGSTDPSITQNSKVVILCAGCRPDVEHGVHSCLDANVKLFKDLVPKLAKLNRNAVFVVVTHPVEPLTFLAWKLSGLPFERVIGIGTNYESQSFRFHLSEKLGIAANSINAWVLGEHGECPVPVWSSVNVAGVTLSDLHKTFGKSDDKEGWSECFNKVLQSRKQILKSKGSINWAPAIGVYQICKAVVHNERSVYSVSTCAKHWNQSEKYGLKQDVFISLPCVIGKNGVLAILAQTLDSDESEKLKKCSEMLYDCQKNFQV